MKYHSAEQLLTSICTPEEAANVRRRIAESQMTQTLVNARLRSGMTQKQVAEKLGWTQGRVSKLENGNDFSLSFREVHLYLRAVGANVPMILGRYKKPNAAEKIRESMSTLQSELNKLIQIHDGNDCPELSKKLRDFFIQTSQGLSEICVSIAMQNRDEKQTPPLEDTTSSTEYFMLNSDQTESALTP